MEGKLRYLAPMDDDCTIRLATVADAPALARTLDGVWAAARRRVLGLSPLALRKP